MKKQNPVNKQQYAYQILRSRILDGTYSPGYRIVISQIAKELSLSAIPVREAIRQLEADGLIEYKQYSGAVVTPIDEQKYVETLSVLAVMEGYATALSSLAFPFERIAKLQDLNEAMKKALKEFDFVRFGQLNRTFHDQIYEYCQNQYLIENIRQTWSRLDSIRRMGSLFIPVRAKQSVQEHDQLISMLKNQRPFDEIERFAREHKMNMVKFFNHMKKQGTSIFHS
ncbi:GntR family transcriptional regulator [Thermoflavimicrobium dichotomicum]|nr:GntR family transcriptional regulator [Thermoflavimicrobium dichotomicum]